MPTPAEKKKALGFRIQRQFWFFFFFLPSFSTIRKKKVDPSHLPLPKQKQKKKRVTKFWLHGILTGARKGRSGGETVNMCTGK